MGTQAERLKQARIDAGYRTARQAAESLGVAYSTYAGHENGSRGFSDEASAYARKFRVDLEWLLTGKTTSRKMQPRVALVGVVGGGHAVYPVEGSVLDHVEAPAGANEELGALAVRGDSMYPLLSDGDVIFFSYTFYPPSALIGKLVVCKVEDGATYVKTLRRGASPDTWTLDSFNAPPIENVRIEWIRRVKHITKN